MSKTQKGHAGLLTGNQGAAFQKDAEETDKISELLQCPYRIIDILPRQVPKESAGQYFSVEKYFLTRQLASVKQKHINVVLKLNCYMDVAVGGELNPAPDRIAAAMNERSVYIMTGDSMILSEPDETYMTLFNPDESLLELVAAIAQTEGLFVWKP